MLKLNFRVALTLLVALFPWATHASALLDNVNLVTASSVSSYPEPAVQSFTVTTAGSYTITLTDAAWPAALGSLQAAISTSSGPAVTLTAAGTKSVTLAAGTYYAQVLATAASGSLGGSFNIDVAPAAGGTDLLSFGDNVPPVGATSNAALGQSFTVTQAGNYTMTLTDNAFPVAFSSLEALVIPYGVGTPVIEMTSAGTSSSTYLAAGTYQVVVIATVDSTADAGLYSVSLTGPATALSLTEPVGTLSATTAITVPSAETVSLKLSDLAYPSALSTLKAAAVQGGSVLQIWNAGSTTVSAAAGSMQLFVYALPNSSTGQGSYGLWAYDSSSTLADIANPVFDSSHYGYAYTATLASAGSYQLSLNDFSMPRAFGSLYALVEQKAVQLSSPTANAAGTAVTSTYTAASGPVNVVVFPTLSSSSYESLFGLALSAASSGTVALNATQGVGASFSSSSLSIPSSGSYAINAADLAFPAALSNLAVIITSGQNVVGEIYGAGQIPFTANSSSTYVINVLAQVGSSASYGLYGMNAAVAPTVSLTSSASSVSSGGTVTLTWSSTGATSCTASGGWTGTLPSVSGSQQSSAISAATTYTVTCTGQGGSATASTQVTVNTSSSSSSHGGGAMDLETLELLVMLLLWQLWRQRRRTLRGRD